MPIDRPNPLHIRHSPHSPSGLRDTVEKLKQEALTDHLTGLYNRRYLENQIEKLGKSGIIVGATFVMLDIDDFKKINDSESHDKGDQILRSFGQIIQGNIHATDIFGRWGGDEFLCIFPNLTDDDKIHQLLFHLENKIQESGIRASFGSATDSKTDPKKPFDFNQTLNRADKDLIEKKQYKNLLK